MPNTFVFEVKLKKLLELSFKTFYVIKFTWDSLYLINTIRAPLFANQLTIPTITHSYQFQSSTFTSRSFLHRRAVKNSPYARKFNLKESLIWVINPFDGVARLFIVLLTFIITAQFSSTREFARTRATELSSDGSCRSFSRVQCVSFYVSLVSPSSYPTVTLVI